MTDRVSRSSAALQLFGIVGFLIAQPVFDLLGGHPAYFIAHGAAPVDLVAFSVLLSFVLPGALWLSIAPLGWLSERLWWLAYLVTIGLCVAAFAADSLLRLPAIQEGSPWLVGLASFACSVLVVFAYARFQGLRRVVSFVSPAAIVFPLLFLFYTPVSKLVLPEPERAHETSSEPLRAPVVMIILDELPLASLLNEANEIDGLRYPSLARLARGATWYRNAFSVATYTERAVPAILTSQIPRRARPSNWKKHPNNLFTLLGGAQGVVGFETVTRLCPGTMCPDRMIPERFDARLINLMSDTGVVGLHMLLPAELRRSLPPINGAWKNFGHRHRGFAKKETERFMVFGEESAHPDEWALIQGRSNGGQRRLMKFMQLIHDGEEAGLYFFHLNLPHGPWLYYPSGREYGPASYFPHGLDPFRTSWFGEPFERQQGAQRHLAQLQFVDHLVGLLLDELEHTGLYDRAILLLLSDHGASFREGHHLRGVSDEGWADVLSVPFFLKVPGQTEGRVDDRLVSTLDALPTLADLLGIEVSWPIDGRSLIGPRAEPRTKIPAVKVVDDKGRSGGLREYPLLELDPASVEQQRAASAGFLRSLYRPGAEATGPFAFGPHRELHGRRVRDTEEGPPIDAIARSLELSALEELDPEAEILPGLVRGCFDADSPIEPGTELAIDLNGEIVTTTWTYRVRGREVCFSSLLPESVISAGPNRVGLWSLESGPNGLVRRRVGHEAVAP